MKNYKRQCGCIYGDDEATSWYACKQHALANATANVRPWWLYILRLQDEKYYVGITNRKQPYDRIRQHGGILGAQWTKIHKPLELLELRQLDAATKSEAEKEEQKQTLELMRLYGHGNVRGGQLTYRGGYVKFMNRYFRDYEWKNFVGTTATIGFLLLVILFLELK